MELNQLTDWLWCLSTDCVHAYAVGEGDGFCLIDTSTAGNDEAVLELLGGLAGSAQKEVKIVEIFLTHGHSDYTTRHWT
jgi:glyoxylase-like metal-dependent hydrolase (beta-lactamase superfamily II)